MVSSIQATPWVGREPFRSTRMVDEYRCTHKSLDPCIRRITLIAGTCGHFVAGAERSTSKNAKRGARMRLLSTTVHIVERRRQDLDKAEYSIHSLKAVLR